MNTSALKNILGLGIVVVGLVFFTWFFKIQQISKLPFGSYHAWRQADCIAMTNKLYKGPSSILTPTTYYTKDDGTTIAAGEFPALNFLVAQVYKVFQKSEATYRYIVFIFYIIGILFLYLLFIELSHHPVFSALLSLLIASGSVLVYYAINFLPDVPAFSLSMVGLYILTVAKRKNKIIAYGFGIVILTLSVSMKLTIGIVLAGITVLLLVEMLMHGKKKFNIQALLYLTISFFMIVGWYYHAYKLDHAHSPFIFLTETRSYWQTYFLERPLIWHDVVHKWLPQVFLPIVWLLIMLGGLTSFFTAKKLKIEWILFACVSMLLAMFFFIMMYRQFYLHDYLWVSLLPVVVLFGIALLMGLAGIKNKWAKTAAGLLMFVLLVLQTFNTRLVLNERYFAFNNNWIFNQDLWGLKNELREHGVDKNDKVISIPDGSPNISLVVLDQDGFTNYRDRNRDSVGVMKSIDMGAKYLIVSNEEAYKKDYLKPFLKFELFNYRTIRVFDLRSFRNK